MFSRIGLYYRTVKNLKWIQLFYQIWYRIKIRFININIYTEYDSSDIHKVVTSYHQILIPSVNKCQNSLEFNFLNKAHKFIQIREWEFLGYGKLWNYNLQYFDYLHDTSLSYEDKISLLEDFSEKLLDGSVKPEPYPVSIRLINWIIFYAQTGYCSDKFQKTLKRQINYLNHNLEYHIQANHLLENYIALYFGGLCLRDIHLISRASKGLTIQLKEQVLEDGGHYECTPMYHNIVLTRLLLLLDAVRQNEFSRRDDKKIICLTTGKMLGWLKAFSFRNGTVANFNDATTGIAPLPVEIFRVADLMNIQYQENQLKGSGYRKNAFGNFEVIIDVGNIIPAYQPGHAHSDMLSFCLQHAGNPIIVDAGTSTYMPGLTRSFQRSTMAHNTVVINDENQSLVWGSFRVGARALLELLQDMPNLISAQHNGYFERFGLFHKRTFLLKELDSMVILDEIIGTSNRKVKKITALFHFDYTIKPSFCDSFKKNVVRIGDTLSITFDGMTQMSLTEYDQALAFNVTKKAYVLAVTFDNQLTTQINLT